MNRFSVGNKINDMTLCTMCSKWSPKDQWLNEKCPACGQILILADYAETCPNCGFVARKQDIVNGRCPRCR